MTAKQVQELVSYWQITAEHDYDTMLALFKIKRYSDSLFFGHIILEKILKAHVVKVTKSQAPYVHNLTRLADIAALPLSQKQLDLLDVVNDFNIRARYPEYKLAFYKKCTKKYTEPYFKAMINLYHDLCQKLRQKK